jgi:hypothetical protein
MTGWSLAPLFIAALVPLAAFIGRRRSRSVQPLRLEMARRGETLLLRDDLPEKERARIKFMLGSAFGRGSVLWCILLIMPLVGLVALFSRRFRKNLGKSGFREQSAAAKEQRDLQALHTVIMRANHPALYATVEVAMIIFVVPAMEFARLFDSAGPKGVDLDEDRLVCMVENHKPHLHLRAA